MHERHFYRYIRERSLARSASAAIAFAPNPPGEERKDFERTHGRVNSGEMLQLVINHAQFAWLRMVSALVVQIDEMLDADERVTDADVNSLITGARQLFTASANKEFSDKYQAALQQEPEVVMAHSALIKGLSDGTI